MKILDWLTHTADMLKDTLATYHNWTYLILFLIVFCETGLVIMPLLPGDSLLFAAGTLCHATESGNSLNLIVLLIVLISAAILGDSLNYFIGRWIGDKVFEKDYKYIKKYYLIKAQDFSNKHGGKALILARFAPILRTFAPFVAGVSKMNYSKFLTFSIIGGISWVSLFTCAGYFFGGFEWVKKNTMLIALGIIAISLIPVIVSALRVKFSKS